MALPPIDIDEKTFLKSHFQLQPMPEIVGKVMDAIHSGRATAKQVAELLSSDPGLVAQILKIVNSAYYGLPQQIPDVTHAVAYLGLSEIQRIVLALQAMLVLRPEDEREFTRFWEHSFFSTLTAKVVARRHEPTLDIDDLHIAVLLHDVGKLVYMKFFPEHYAEMARWSRDNGVLLVDAERHYGLPSHQRFGVLLCDRWSLPTAVQRACEFHELEQLESLVDEGHSDPFLKLVCASNVLANLATGELCEELKARTADRTRELLGGTEEDFLLLMGEIYDVRTEAANFLRDL